METWDNRTFAMVLWTMLPALNAAAEPAAEVLPEVQVTDEGQADYQSYATGIIKGQQTPLRDIPQTITVINQEIMEAQGATRLTDALRNVTGITLGAGEGGQIGDNINLRGFSARTDLFLDGFRDRGQYTRDLFALESVEVLKGPSSMLFGRGSTGGVINQVSKLPGSQANSEFTATLGTEDYYRLTADTNQPLSPTSALRVVAMGHTNESTRDVVDAKRYGLAPSLRFGIGTATELTLWSLHQRNRETPDYGLPIIAGKPADVSRDRYFGFTDDDFDQDVDILNARLEYHLSRDWTLRNQTQYGSYRVDASPTVLSVVGTPAPDAAPASVIFTRNRRDREIEDTSMYNQTDLRGRFDTGRLHHNLVAGLELGRDTYDNQGYTWTGLPPITLADEADAAAPDTAVRSKNPTHNTNTGKALGVYVNDEIALAQHWKTVAGLRWDRYQIDAKTLADSGPDTRLQQTDRQFSSRAGLIYQPRDTQSYYLSYGTSFNPSAEAVTLTAANTGLDPERNRSLEVGAKWDLWSGNLAVHTAVFRVEKEDARTTDPVTNIVSNDGNIRVDGAELGASGRLTREWLIFAGYTYLDGEILKSRDVQNGVATEGKTPQNLPRHTASLWTTYTWFRHWEVGGGLVYSSERYVNNANTAKVEGYTRIDASVAYRQPKYDIRLNLLNVNDEEYFGQALASRAVPAQGRTALLSWSYRL